jgi:hypothetical protein
MGPTLAGLYQWLLGFFVFYLGAMQPEEGCEMTCVYRIILTTLLQRDKEAFQETEAVI